MIKITFENYSSLMFDCAQIVYGKSVGVADRDAQWNGGYRIDGLSIKAILEEYDEVYLLPSSDR